MTTPVYRVMAQFGCVAFASATIACSGSSVRTPEAAAPESRASNGDAVQIHPQDPVRVLDAGAAPRRILRYTFPAGPERVFVSESRAVVHVLIDLPRPPAPSQHPPTRMRIGVRPRGPTGDGGFRFDLRVLSAELADSAGVRPEVAAEASRSLSGLAGASGHAVLSPRGMASDVEVTVSRGDPELGREAKRALREHLELIATPLPQQAVGPGARWRATAIRHIGEVQSYATSIWTLVESAGDRLTFDEVIRFEAPSQRMDSVVPGLSLRLDTIEGSGASHSQISTDFPVTTGDVGVNIMLNSTARARGRSVAASFWISDQNVTWEESETDRAPGAR